MLSSTLPTYRYESKKINLERKKIILSPLCTVAMNDGCCRLIAGVQFCAREQAVPSRFLACRRHRSASRVGEQHLRNKLHQRTGAAAEVKRISRSD